MTKEKKANDVIVRRYSQILRSLIIFMLMTAIILASLPVGGAISTGSSGAKDNGIPVQAPVNPAFVDYQGQAIKTGHVPLTVDLSHTNGKKLPEALVTASAYPPKFDLRALGKVTPVKDQGSAGTCWAFATYGSLESTVLVSTNVLMDFSENNLKNNAGFDLNPNNGGGNNIMSSAYLTRWSGPVNEVNDPYNPSSTISPTFSPVYHVQNIYYLPKKASATDLSNIKYALMNYGAVDSSIYYGSSYYNPTTHSYYFPAKKKASENHDITIVGWDDSYSASNFTSRPPGNGAFIVKNSWGTGWGEKGYFYISYYDMFIDTDNAVFTAEPTTNYDNIYQYDPLGWVGSYGYSTNAAWFENKFKAGGNEYLKDVGFYVPQVNSQYQIYVLNGNAVVGTATTSGAASSPGYYTIQLASPVYLTQGTSFTVQVKLTTPGYNYPIPVEYPMGGYSSGAKASAGQSYISSNGVTWTDTTTIKANMNVCLKAYTVKA